MINKNCCACNILGFKGHCPGRMVSVTISFTVFLLCISRMHTLLSFFSLLRFLFFSFAPFHPQHSTLSKQISHAEGDCSYLGGWDEGIPQMAVFSFAWAVICKQNPLLYCIYLLNCFVRKFSSLLRTNTVTCCSHQIERLCIVCCRFIVDWIS